jgi:hypothetical protein
MLAPLRDAPQTESLNLLYLMDFLEEGQEGQGGQKAQDGVHGPAGILLCTPSELCIG